MYKESIDRENKKLKDELRTLKAAMRHITTDSPSKTDLPATRDPLRLQLSSPKGSFSSHIPGLKTLIDTAKGRGGEDEGKAEFGLALKSTPRNSSREGTSRRDEEQPIGSEVETIRSEVETELASLRDKLDSMKNQYKKPPTAPLPSLPTITEVAIQTEERSFRSSFQQTDLPTYQSQAVQTQSPASSPSPTAEPVEKEEDVDPELLSEYELLRDENAALRTLLKRKEERSGKRTDRDCDTVPTKEKPLPKKPTASSKDTMKSPRPAAPCSLCTYLRANGLPSTACARHRK